MRKKLTYIIAITSIMCFSTSTFAVPVKKTNKTPSKSTGETFSLEVDLKETFTNGTFSTGIGLEGDYFFKNSFSVHSGLDFFPLISGVSITIPATLRYKFFNNKNFDANVGLGGFFTTANSQFAGGVIAEAGGIYKLSGKWSIPVELDLGIPFPYLGLTIGLKSGIRYSF